MSSRVLARVVAEHLAALNGRDLDRLVSFYAEDAVLELPASPKVEGRAAIRRAFQVFFEQWEEQSTYDRVVVEGSTAAVEGITTGRHRTLHLRLPGRIPTGSSQYRHAFAAFLGFRNGKIVRHRVYYDARDLVRQLLGTGAGGR
ncbi:MAG: nuclear transport factor 2 family protein [Armatimonadota bacterium]|nr:nuclear transport factor 2 family protein [Armatimonadota bacterium]MDR7505618.1 nuclear transport factor 2 family protein [Armatimonadota bacterium]MDR7547035.1 nuclear transport factor 2 family protein [Armatimonadota bacterium]MDR7552646.1 nuclear transport factor 2 family protein [Armatimonadota bacterium]MDR7558057.1 nuclear transport factor 2 family protein [Armatimonadota bacterium]